MKYFTFTILIILGMSITTAVYAVEYLPIVDIPRIGQASGLSTEDYVRALYALSITVAALLAIVRIVFAGVKYVLSDVVTDKGSAIKDIQGALLGLLIVLSTVLILNTINPNLTKLDIFGNAPGPLSSNSGSVSLGTKIGDTYGFWCGNIFTLVCNESYQNGLDRFTQSCINDAKGTIQTTYLDKYTCVSK